MASLQIDALASHMDDTVPAEKVPQPSNIKIRFKKGVVFANATSESAGLDAMVSQLPIRLSPESEKKRKVAGGTDFEDDEHLVKRTKTEEKSKAVKSIAIDAKSQTAERANSPTSSMATTTIINTPKKVPAQAASIFRKLAKKLSTQPPLLDHLKEYRTSITSQHREDAKTIATLQAKISTMTKEAAERELRAAEDLKASQDMVVFWTDSCNDEYEGMMFLKEKLRGMVGKIEDIGQAEALGDVSAGFGKGMQIEFGLQKLGAELSNILEERKVDIDWGSQDCEGSGVSAGAQFQL